MRLLNVFESAENNSYILRYPVSGFRKHIQNSECDKYLHTIRIFVTDKIQTCSKRCFDCVNHYTLAILYYIFNFSNYFKYNNYSDVDTKSII